jgi:hypothetical protein
MLLTLKVKKVSSFQSQLAVPVSSFSPVDFGSPGEKMQYLSFSTMILSENGCQYGELKSS